MITEDYVSFETAKLLKEKGFDEDIDLWYDENGEIFFQHKYDISQDWRVKQGQEVYQCPTFQMAMKWLRGVHNIHIEVRLTNHSFSSLIDIPRYYWIIFNAKEVKWMDESTAHKPMSYETFEEACEAAIKYYLENLI